MRSQESIQELLCEILGSKNVYFQPPESLKLVYPCIVYFKDTYQSTNANNQKYIIRAKYSITHISKKALDDAVDRINALPNVHHQRSYTSDNLYHNVFEAYF